MAQVQLIRLVDDLSGVDAAETLQFALDGAQYEIDLSERHASELRATLERYIAHGRRATIARPAQRPTTRSARARTARIRQWALANGYELSTRGRLPDHVARAWAAAAPRSVV